MTTESPAAEQAAADLGDWTEAGGLGMAAATNARAVLDDRDRLRRALAEELVTNALHAAGVVRGWVVVLFGEPADGWCSLSECPLGTAEWFPTREDADRFCAGVPEGMQPHMLIVARDERFQEAIAAHGRQRR